MARSVMLEAPAKVNLRLRVLAQETSGYHSLETLFCAISLADSLHIEVVQGPGIELVVRGGIDTGPVGENLVVRAARRFYAELGKPPALRIRLEKRIPSAAGLGGGSSDAAAALRALNALHGEPFAPERLLQWGSELGSDVPFFLCGSAFALGWSRGERLLALPPLPSHPVLVAHPGAAMPTGGAFRRIAERRGGAYQPLAFAVPLAQLGDWAGVARLAENDFDPVAEECLPRLRSARRLLMEGGASLALLAGSGASLFGVFHPGQDLVGVEAGLRALGFATWCAETLLSLPEPSVSKSPCRLDGSSETA